MNKQAKTISVSGGEYAKVAERIKLFREDCPNGLIETEMRLEGDNVIFKAHILKDKSKPDSAEATGHAVGSTKGVKAYEKQESIAIGRALAVLGYLASGEIASSEEMEEFHAYKAEQLQAQVAEAIEKIGEAKNIDELKSVWASLTPEAKLDESVISAKEGRKNAYSK